MNKLTTICVVLVFVSLSVCTQVIAQAPSDLIAIADDVDKALNAHDLDLWLSYLTDDAVFDYVPLPPPEWEGGDKSLLRGSICGIP